MTAVVTSRIPGWQLPTGFAIHGEMTADHSKIILVGVGPDWEVAQAAKQMALLTPNVQVAENLGDSSIGALELPLSWPALVQLSHTFGSFWHPGPHLSAWARREVMLRTSTMDDLPDLTPDGLALRPYQIPVAGAIAHLGRFFCWDDPGVGKTPPSVMGLVYRHALGHPVFPCVIVCPAGAVDVWTEHWAAWAPQFKCVAWRGPTRQRFLRHKEIKVYVTSYDLALRDAPLANKGALVKLGARSVIIDECDYIKNPDSKRSMAARRLAHKAPDAVILLSGTPIEAHVGEVWPAMNAADPRAWPSAERHRARYNQVIQRDYAEEVVGFNPHTKAELDLSMLGQERRVSIDDALPGLPPKIYSKRIVHLPPAYRKVYDDMRDKMLAELPDRQILTIPDLLQMFGRLGQLAAAACDVEYVYGPEVDEETGQEKEHIHVHPKLPSWKIDALLEELHLRRNRQGVVFAPSRQLVELAGAEAEKAGHRVGYLTGAIPPAKRKPLVIDPFQRGDLDLIFATTGAGGVAVTLTAASYAIYLTSPSRLRERIQSEGRVRRSGSEGHEHIEYIDIMAADTVDQRIPEILYPKAEQLSKVVKDMRIVRELLGGK